MLPHGTPSASTLRTARTRTTALSESGEVGVLESCALLEVCLFDVNLTGNALTAEVV